MGNLHLMRILVFITIMGAVGLAVLLLLPDIRQQEVKAPSALFPVEQVNPTVRDVTPDHALPGPEIITPQITRLPSLALPVSTKAHARYKSMAQCFSKNGWVNSPLVIVFVKLAG